MTEPTRSEYAIENLLPEGERRFLKIRDEFMRITNRRVVDACVLEMMLFESVRLLNVMDPDSKTAEFNLFYKGTRSFSESALWVQLPSKRVLHRLCGFASSVRTVERSIKRLAELNFVVLPETQKRGGSFRRLLLNFTAVSAALANAGFSDAEWNDGTEAIKGTNSLLSLPAAKYHALYPVLVDGIRLATGESDEAPARMSLILLQTLWAADHSVRAGEGPARPYSRNAMLPMMRFGSDNNWWGHLRMLAGSSHLLTRREDLEDTRARWYEPNLAAIRSCVEHAIQAKQTGSAGYATDRTMIPDNLPRATRQSAPQDTTDHTVDTDNSPSTGHIPEPLPELHDQLREGDVKPATESLALKVPRASLPRFSSKFQGGKSVRDTRIPKDLLALDLPALGIRSDVVSRCSSTDGEPLVLAGGFGTGKTVLAAAIAWAIMERESSPTATWVPVETLTPDLRHSGFTTDAWRGALAQLMDVAPRGPIVFDGVEDADGHKKLLEVMAGAVQKHLGKDRQLIVTTSLRPGELELAFGPKIGARLASDAVVIDCSEPLWITESAHLRVVGD